MDLEIRLSGCRNRLIAAYRGRVSESIDSDTSYIGPDKYHLNYCGREDCLPGHTYGPNMRSSYLIHLVKKGRGIYTTKSKTYQIRENQVFLIFPGEEVFYQADTEDPWFYDWVGFSGHGAEECVAAMGFSRTLHVVDVIRTLEMSDCISRIMSLRKLTLSEDLFRTAEMLRIFALIMEDQSERERCETSRGSRYSAYVREAMDFMRANYRQRIRIGELAGQIGVNRSHLANSFRKEANLSPQEFLLNIRMDKAVSLLQETSFPIKKIAEMVGYGDVFAFSKIFKKHVGVAPRHLRNHLMDMDWDSREMISEDEAADKDSSKK